MHFLLIILLAATHSQIITAYTIPFDSQDSTDTTIAQFPRIQRTLCNRWISKINYRLWKANMLNRKGLAWDKKNESYMSRVKGRRWILTPQSIRVSGWCWTAMVVSLMCFIYLIFFPFHEIPSFDSIGIPIYDRYLRNKVGWILL